MKEQLRVCQVQPDLVWEDIDANLQLLEEMLEELEPDTDLVVLPETFSTGFTMQSEKLAEGEDGKAVRWMKKIAGEKQCYLTGSLIFREQNGDIFNRLLWVSPGGIEDYYDKRHLFRPGGERESFNPGKERKLFRLESFHILPQICYDLRFPVFSRNRGDYDLLLYVANWPAARHQVWEILTRARAMENQCYVLGTNRVGTDGTGTASVGGTCVIDPKGEELFRMDHQPGIQNSLIQLDLVKNFRAKFPAWRDADQFEPGWEPDREPGWKSFRE
jgi:omega-amidase